MNSIEIKMLYGNGTYDKFNGIIACVMENIKTDKVASRLKELKNDTTTIAGHPISDFSLAALDVLGIEKYQGDDEGIIEIIDSQFKF